MSVVLGQATAASLPSVIVCEWVNERQIAQCFAHYICHVTLFELSNCESNSDGGLNAKAWSVFLFARLFVCLFVF